MPSITALEKNRLRAQVRARLEELTAAERQASDRALFARFLALPQLTQAGTVLLYYGMGWEPDTARLITPLLERGCAVALPRCLPGNRMEARQIWAGAPLVRHPLGMLEPGAECPVVPAPDIALALAPGLAFDRCGGRLGRGGGYYDRWLAGFHGFKAALCRSCALVDKLPLEECDLPVDLVICEDGFYGPAAGLSCATPDQGRDPEVPPLTDAT